MKKVARTVSIKSTVPDYTAKHEYEEVVDARFVSVPFYEMSEARNKKIRCTNLDKGTVDEVVRGLVYASLAITDDKDKTLHNICKKNPWHLETLKAITGSRTKAHQPLSQILVENMNLEIDEHIDVAGRTRSGQAVDTHGYIAHNDELIVLAYRCSTSAFDWLTSVPMASSAWDVDKDFGYSGYCGGLECFGCSSDDFKPCVNSEFYHSFLASLPFIKRNIEPLLAADQPPRKLFVVGHSLGAAVATLAACYFMLEFDWTILPHSLVMVTAGSPRSCCRSMKEVIDERRLKMGTSVRLYRVVKGQDIVAAFPRSTSGFTHIVPKIIIDDDGTIFQEEEALFDEEQEAASVLEDNTRATFLNKPSRIPMKGANKYDRFLAKMPKGIRDHLPDAYLMSLFQARGIRCGTELERPEDTIIKADCSPPNPALCSIVKEERPHPDPVLCPTFGPNIRLSEASSSILLGKNKYFMSSFQARGIRRGPQLEQLLDDIIKEDDDPVLWPIVSPNVRLGSLLLEKNKRYSSVRRLFRRKVGPA